MARRPAFPSERTQSKIERQTDRISEDPFNRAVGAQTDELSEIDGVGDTLAKRLRRNGFSYIRDVADEPTGNLAQVEGVSEARAEQLKNSARTANRPDFDELEDLNGVGPSTETELRDAGIRDPYELRGKTQRELAAIDGIGPQRAAKIRADVEYEAPAGATETGFDPETESGTTIYRKNRGVSLKQFNDILKTPEQEDGIAPQAGNVFARGPDRQEAIADHADRTEESRTADESFNAPIMLDEETWARNKDQYDYPGVDTIPRSRKLERARDKAAKAKKRGAIRGIKADSEAAGDWRTAGMFRNTRKIEIDTSFRQAEDTLAHEVGHAADKEFDRPSGVDARGNDAGFGIFDDPEVDQEARELSAQRRGKDLETDYLDSDNEVFADLFAEATLNPRRAKKEAPNAFRALQDEVGERLGFF